ncbi:MAG: phosphonate ABC transporter, permease protein PhnE [Candidatus Thiodiazotropha sp.]
MNKDYSNIITRQEKASRRLALQVLIVFLIILLSSYYTGLLDSERMVEGIPSILQLAGESIPPNFSDVKGWLVPLLDTLAMSIAGTALAVFFSIPLGLLAARNTSPHPVVYQISRGLLNALRAIPELILGIIFVAAVGFGALPGVLALGFHSIGMVGKFISEAVEHVDNAPIEAAHAAGATRFQMITHGVIPQVLPQIADVTIYRWEYNFRASTVMGMVGAGGIGFELMSSLRLMRYDEVSAILLVILLMVTMVDGIGQYLRTKFK